MAKSYTQKDVQLILSNLRATPSDYLILTYFKIHKISSGPLYDKYKRRFNNIIISEAPQITRALTDTVFLPKSFQLLLRDLSAAPYISCIHSKVNKGCTPVILQFFDKDRGIQYRQLDCKCAPTALATVLSQNGSIRKTVAYCGDYCFLDPGNVNSTSSHVSSLRLLSEKNMLNLPSCDGFLNMLFEVLLDYLPENVVKSLVMLGEVMLHSNDNSVVAKHLLSKYKEWKESDEHILMSQYADYVTENYQAINSYLLPLQHLPCCLRSLFSSVQQRFLLIFIKELYRRLRDHQMTDNNAVVYYSHLHRIKDTITRYQDGQTSLSAPWNYLNAEIQTLKDNKQMTDVEDDHKLQQLCKSLTLTIDVTYTRALKYLQPLLQQFENFDSYSWLLLDGVLEFSRVHDSYHVIKQVVSCGNCEELRREVQVVNARMAGVSLLDVRSVEAKWLLVLRTCSVPLVLDLVEYLLALPASYEVARSGAHEGCAESAIRMNFGGVGDVEVVERVEKFFGEYLEQVREVIRRNETPFLVE